MICVSWWNTTHIIAEYWNNSKKKFSKPVLNEPNLNLKISWKTGLVRVLTQELEALIVIWWCWKLERFEKLFERIECWKQNQTESVYRRSLTLFVFSRDIVQRFRLLHIVVGFLFLQWIIDRDSFQLGATSKWHSVNILEEWKIQGNGLNNIL